MAIVGLAVSLGKSVPQGQRKATMSKITITNSYTSKSTTVDASKPLTKSKIKAIRRRLCSDDCTSGDDLGARGPQEDGYASLLNRAQSIIVTGWCDPLVRA